MSPPGRPKGEYRSAQHEGHPMSPPPSPPSLATLGAAVLAAALACAVTGCAPMIIAAGVGATAVVATDRRSTGAQVDDESIELKINTSITSSYGNSIHVNVTSYNGIVLVTGEVSSTAIKDDIIKVATTTPRVKGVENYLVIGPLADFSSRSNDSYITSKVKTRFVESDKLSTLNIKVVTEHGTVYLMGIVSRAEGDAAGQIAATTSGVARVVKVFEYTN
jgi:osmotically-inducible protein OsmY